MTELARLRDRFFELSARREHDAGFHAAIAAIDSAPHAHVDGLAVSFHPSARFKAVRFVDVRHLPAALHGEFTRPSAELPELAAVFVDPQELSLRTYENIIPLDRQLAVADLALVNRRPLGDGFRFDVVTTTPLGRLDELGLYVPPLNPGSRGGERFIFHSAGLADALTRAVRAALPADVLVGFSHVNPVIRCNRFEPGDEPFHRHLDTPYRDASRHHVSRYTLLLYVTGGHASPALAIGEVVVDAIDPMTCLVIHQRHAHEGKPYVDGRKVFLRTELVFEDRAVGEDPAISEAFAKACYLTGESVFTPELARHADDYYNRVAAAHWQGWRAVAEREPIVHKQYRGVHFLANGHDFWFPKRSVTLAECAALTLLDHFNCAIAGVAFRAGCQAEVLHAPGSDCSWIDDFLAPFDAPPAEPAITALDKPSLFPDSEVGNTCCSGHGSGDPVNFDATRCDDVIELYERAQAVTRPVIDAAPILMMGQEVFLDPARLVIAGDKIHVLSSTALAPLNFAACWNSFGDRAESYLDVAATLEALQPLVPPILVRETPRCYHLMFDLFRNGWVANTPTETVQIPRIRNASPDEVEGDGPWFSESRHARHVRRR